MINFWSLTIALFSSVLNLWGRLFLTAMEGQYRAPALSIGGCPVHARHTHNNGLSDKNN